jgi:hypothetical protein
MKEEPMINSTEAVWDERLMCHVVALDYVFSSHTGQLFMSDGGCCDMTGCVALFAGIDPQVTAIDTYSGDEIDTMYRKDGNAWTAFLPNIREQYSPFRFKTQPQPSET